MLYLDENFDWASACEDREVVYDLWTRQPPQLEYTEYKTGLFGDVSSVHLLRVCFNNDVILFHIHR
jgi:hypothetical protein